MNKRLLRQIPVILVKEEWIRLMEQIRHTAIDYLIAVERKTADKKRIIILSFINNSSRDVDYRVFINKKDYITQDLTFSTPKWKVGCLQNIFYNERRKVWYKNCILADNGSINILKDFFNKKEYLLEEIDNLQQTIMAARLNKKHQKIKDRINKRMKDVPRLPNGFRKWINDIALYDSRYIYYEYKPKKILDGYCTHCKSDIKVKGARYNKKGICPKCKSPVIFKSIGKVGHIADFSEAALIQEVSDTEFVIRYFAITKCYSDYKNPKLSYIELARDFFNKNSEGQIEQYEWRTFKQTGEVRWCDAFKKISSCFLKNNYLFYDTVLYEKNLDNILKGTIWEYSAIKEYVTNAKGVRFHVWAYLSKYKEFPQLEYLVKLGLNNLVCQIIYYHNYYYKDDINFKGNNLYEVLNIQDKEQLRTAQRIDAGIHELRIIKMSKKVNLKLTDEEIKFIIANNLGIESIIEIFQHTKLSFYKMFKYVDCQSRLNNNISYTNYESKINYTFRDWLDYIKDCQLLKYDLTNDFILFPRDLAKTHRKTYLLIEENKGKIFNSVIVKMHDKLNKLFGWNYKNSMIIVPKNVDEIIKEGQTLYHCVGRYVEDIVKGKKIILFLRNKTNINNPFYTIEIDPYNYEINQCRGKNDASADANKEVRSIIDRFERERLYSLKFKQAV